MCHDSLKLEITPSPQQYNKQCAKEDRRFFSHVISLHDNQHLIKCCINARFEKREILKEREKENSTLQKYCLFFSVIVFNFSFTFSRRNSIDEYINKQTSSKYIEFGEIWKHYKNNIQLETFVEIQAFGLTIIKSTMNNQRANNNISVPSNNKNQKDTFNDFNNQPPQQVCIYIFVICISMVFFWMFVS